MKIVIGIDRREQQADALAFGASLARMDGADVILAHVYPWAPSSTRLGAPYAMSVEEDAEQTMRAASDTLGDLPHTTRLIPDLSVPKALHALAVEEDADLLVVGSCHRGPIGRAMLGSVGDRVIHGAPCPVVIAPRGHEADGPLTDVAVAYDGSPESRRALGWATDVAVRAGGRLTVLTVVDVLPITAFPMGATMGGASFDVSETLGGLRATARNALDLVLRELPESVHPSGELLEGPVQDALAAAAKDRDVLVIGSRSYGPLGHLMLGSVSRGVVHTATCPVVVIPRSVADEKAPAQDAGNAVAGVTG